MAYSTEQLGILSLLPGRVRLHLHGWLGDNGENIEKRLRRVEGVKDVHLNPVTGNALVRFDPRTTDTQQLLGELQDTWCRWLGARQRAPAPAANVLADQGSSTSGVVRIGVRGLLGHAAGDSLWFAAGFLGHSLGLPLAGLGPLHVVMDIAVWTMALRSGTGAARYAAKNQQEIRGWDSCDKRR